MTLTLRFTEWSCGHHGQRPADIPVDTPQQASLILAAISHAISQPGHASAVLLTDTHAVAAYVTDDHVSTAGGGPTFPDQLDGQGDLRSTVIYGTEAEIALIASPAYRAAVEWVYGDTPKRWDGKSALDDYTVLSALSLEELEAIGRPSEYFESNKLDLFNVPPVFLPACEALRELQAEMDEINGVEAPYELPYVLQCREILPARGQAPLHIDYFESRGSYIATVDPSNDPCGAWESELLHVSRSYASECAPYYIGQVTRKVRDHRLYHSENIYMVPDCYGNLTEVKPWN